MPNVKTNCPFCADPFTSTYMMKHIMKEHLAQIFNEKELSGRQHRLQIHKMSNYEPFTLNVSETPLYCCLGCNQSCAKKASAERHYPKCGTEQKQRLEVLKSQFPQVSVYNYKPTTSEPSEEMPGLQVDDAKMAWCLFNELLNKEIAVSTLKINNQNRVIAALKKKYKISDEELEELMYDDQEDDDTISYEKEEDFELMEWNYMKNFKRVLHIPDLTRRDMLDNTYRKVMANEDFKKTWNGVKQA